MAGTGRVGNVKAKSGCLTCKRRKLKCDEGKPTCMRCENSHQHCAGYPHLFAELQRPPFAVASYPPERLLSAFKATPHEWQAYDFYINQACPNIGGSLDHDFWHELVLRFAQDQESVRSAVFSLGHLSWHAIECRSGPCHCEHYQHALRYYNKSIVSLDHTGKDHALILMLTCALFTCLEAILGHPENVIALIRGGHEIGEQLLSNPDSSTLAIIRLFDRMRLLSMLHGQPLSNPSSYVTSSCDSVNFTSLSDARYALYFLMNDSIDFVQVATSAKYTLDSNDSAFGSLRLQQLETKRRFEVWISNSMSLSLRTRASEAFAVLEALYAVANLWLANALIRTEYVSEFEHGYFSIVLDKASQFLSQKTTTQPLFVFEMNWIPPLFFVGIKCRDPTLRRAAVSLLSLTARREGIWDQAETLGIVNRVIQLEEGSGRLLHTVDAGFRYVNNGKMRTDVVYSWPLADGKQWMVMVETLIVDDPSNPSAVDSRLFKMESWSNASRFRNQWCTSTPGGGVFEKLGRYHSATLPGS